MKQALIEDQITLAGPERHLAYFAFVLIAAGRFRRKE